MADSEVATLGLTPAEPPDQVMVYVFSVADFESRKRRRRVLAVFDEFPELRPLRVGPVDPPRIKVTTMREAMGSAPLPICYLTVRNSRPQYEGGEINLFRGRGSWTGRRAPGDEHLKDPSLIPHSVRAGYAASWLEASVDGGREDLLRRFFQGLCEEMDAFYGFVGALSLWRQRMRTLRRGQPFPQLERELPDVMWLNYFGASWLARAGDRLAGLPYERSDTANRGVILKTTPSPVAVVQEADPASGYQWKRPLIEALGPDTFKFRDQEQGGPGELVPSWAEHFAVTAGTDKMPWVDWRRDLLEQRRVSREKTFPRKMRATEAAAYKRIGLPIAKRTHEFSTSIDAAEFRRLFNALATAVGGDFGGAVGKALLAEIAAAPVNTERTYQLAAEVGGSAELIELTYSVDDVDTVDFWILSSEEFSHVCQRLTQHEDP